MANAETREIPYEILLSRGLIKNTLVLRSFSRSPVTAVATINDLWPVTGELVHQIAASPIDIVSASANDTAAGSGARTLLVEGLDANFDQISETIALDGLTPVQTVNSYIRHHLTSISTSGVYAQTETPSHAGDITLSYSGTADPAGIITDFEGFSNFGTFGSHRTVPRGFIGFLRSLNINTDQNFPSTVAILTRPNANIVTAPFNGGGTIGIIESLQGTANFNLPTPFPVNEFTDIWIAHRPNSNMTTASASYALDLYPI